MSKPRTLVALDNTDTEEMVDVYLSNPNGAELKDFQFTAHHTNAGRLIAAGYPGLELLNFTEFDLDLNGGTTR